MSNESISGMRTSIGKRLRFEVLKRDRFTCQYCGTHGPNAKLVIDHIHAVSAGGDNSPGNLRTACQSCNAGKSDVPLIGDLSVKVALAASQHGCDQDTISGFVLFIMDHVVDKENIDEDRIVRTTNALLDCLVIDPRWDIDENFQSRLLTNKGMSFPERLRCAVTYSLIVKQLIDKVVYRDRSFTNALEYFQGWYSDLVADSQRHEIAKGIA